MAISRLESAPGEILEKIVLCVIAKSFLGPPSDIIRILQLSKRLYKKLAFRHNPYLYACIFPLKFDIRAPVDRLQNGLRHLESSTELVKRFQTLKRLKDNNYACDTNSLRADMWTAYIMFLENDVNNSRQLIEFANVDRFAFDYVSLGGPLHHPADANGDWIVDSEENALALWLFWFTDKERVQTETPDERQQILQALAYLFVGSFKYASTHAPVTSFRIPAAKPPPTHHFSRALPLAALPVSTSVLIPSHFGSELILARPLLVPPSLLSCVVRLEASIAQSDWPLSSRIPATREDAIAIGWSGPTKEDHARQKVPTTRLIEWGKGMERHEHDWMRLRSCYDPWDPRPLRYSIFTPGMLDGVWVGRWFGIPINQFNDILQAEQSGQAEPAPHPQLVYPVPMQFRLREHHQREPEDVVEFQDISCDGTGKGVFNAWFPKDTTMTQTDKCLQINIPHRKSSTYQTYDASVSTRAALDHEFSLEHKSTNGDGVWDIILTAETDTDFAEAWGHKQYCGRVRAWDGLIILVRKAADAEGQWIFKGYLHSMQNLIGRWRETATPIGKPAWEGVWSMTKMNV